MDLWQEEGMDSGRYEDLVLRPQGPYYRGEQVSDNDYWMAGQDACQERKLSNSWLDGLNQQPTISQKSEADEMAWFWAESS